MKLTSYQRRAIHGIAVEWRRDGVDRAAAREHCQSIVEDGLREESARVFDRAWPDSVTQ